MTRTGPVAGLARLRTGSPTSVKRLRMSAFGTSTSGGQTRLAASSVARAQGVFNVVGGLWPLVSLRTFEAVYGRKTDRYLEHTVGGLLVSVGLVQLASRNEQELVSARRIGIGTALTLLAIDAIYVPQGKMRWTYLQDALCEVGWLAAWAMTRKRSVT